MQNCITLCCYSFILQFLKFLLISLWFIVLFQTKYPVICIICIFYDVPCISDPENYPRHDVTNEWLFSHSNFDDYGNILDALLLTFTIRSLNFTLHVNFNDVINVMQTLVKVEVEPFDFYHSTEYLLQRQSPSSTALSTNRF